MNRSAEPFDDYSFSGAPVIGRIDIVDAFNKSITVWHDYNVAFDKKAEMISKVIGWPIIFSDRGVVRIEHPHARKVAGEEKPKDEALLSVLEISEETGFQISAIQRVAPKVPGVKRKSTGWFFPVSAIDWFLKNT